MSGLHCRALPGFYTIKHNLKGKLIKIIPNSRTNGSLRLDAVEKVTNIFVEKKPAHIGTWEAKDN